MVFYQRKEDDWRLRSVIFYLVFTNTKSSFHLLFWLLIDLIIRGISTYLTVQFFSTADVKTLGLLLTSQIIESFVSLRVRLNEKSFVLECIRALHKLVHKRLLGTDWYYLKLADHEEMRRKINESCSSIQAFFELIIENFTSAYELINAILTIMFLCSWKITISLICIYALLYLFYVRKQSEKLLKLRTENNTLYDELQVKYDRVIGRTLDYVLHHEQEKLINQSSSIQVVLESLYFISEYLANQISFVEGISGKFSTLSIVSILITYSENPFIVVPVYHYLSSITNQLDTIIDLGIRCMRCIKDYDLLEPLLNQSKTRLKTKQFQMNQSFTIEKLFFTYKEAKIKRKQFKLELSHPITFQIGETILIHGNSGAGKSTFYDIISGCISNDQYQTNVLIDQSIQLPNAFHNIESLRTLVLQDTQMDFKCSIFTMITDIENEDFNQFNYSKKEQEEKRLWFFLRLVEIDQFVEESLQGQIHIPVENRLSGGQKTRLMLARALNRAEQRQSQILILDEPDRGLPSETTFRIMLNILQWFKLNGILFITLHNDRVREKLPFEHILHIEHGHIKHQYINPSKIDSAA